MHESVWCKSQENNLRSPIQEVVPSICERDAFCTKERLKLCLKPTYWIKRLRNKGAMLLITWCFFLMTA